MLKTARSYSCSQMIGVFSASPCSNRYCTSWLLAFKVRDSAPPNMAGSMPAMPYIFIMSCIRRLSSDKVMTADMSSFFSLSTWTSRFSFPRVFLNSSVRAVVISVRSSSESSFSAPSTSASIRLNARFWLCCSNWEINAESILCFRITASRPCSLNMLIYWLCCTSSVM